MDQIAIRHAANLQKQRQVIKTMLGDWLRLFVQKMEKTKKLEELIWSLKNKN